MSAVKTGNIIWTIFPTAKNKRELLFDTPEPILKVSVQTFAFMVKIDLSGSWGRLGNKCKNNKIGEET